MDAVQLYTYARRYCERAIKNDQGTKYPSVRQAARRFRVPMQDIIDTVEGGDARIIDRDCYFALEYRFHDDPETEAMVAAY